MHYIKRPSTWSTDINNLCCFIPAKRAFKSNDIPCELCYNEDNVDCMKVYCGGDT